MAGNRGHGEFGATSAQRVTKRRNAMGNVFVNIGPSPDGDMAPDGMTMGNPGHENCGAK